MKIPVLAFAGLLLLSSGVLAQNQPAVGGFPGMPIAAPPLRSADSGTSLGAVAPQDAVNIANRIKLRGYVDMSYSDYYVETAGDQGTLGVKSVDLDFLFDFSPVTAEIHLQHEDSTGAAAIGVEQAFVNYAVNQNFSLTVGRQLQLLGYEGDEAMDQFLSTRTYLIGDNFDLFATGALISGAHSGWAPAYGGTLHHNYNDGIRANFNAGNFGLAIGLYDGIWGSDSETTISGFGDGEWGIDVQAAYVITPGLEARVGYARHDEVDNRHGDDDIDQLNFWLSYEMGNFTLAAEYNDYDFLGVDGRSWMLLANYNFTDRFGAAFRYSNEDFDTFDDWKISMGPSLRITENLLMRFEYSYAETDVYGLTPGSGGDRDIHMFTTEGLFTF